ncbi:MAG: amidohydrolase, partial [Anaerolineales bacterium]
AQYRTPYGIFTLLNAKIYTLAEDHPTASAMVIDHGKILTLGDETHCLEFGGNCPPEDLGGSVVIPGLTDAHIHLEHYALSLQKIDCEVPDREECLFRVAQLAEQIPPGQWVLGHGWNQNLWPEGFGTSTDLDAVAPENPVYLTAKSLHAGWANSAALQAAGINHNTPDPADGQIQRDNQGLPTGILFEGAMRLVSEAVPQPSVSDLTVALKQAQENLWRMGITGVHDFDRRDCFTALQLLHAAGDLRLRILKSLPIDDLEHAVALGLRTGFGDDWLQIGSLKAFADGALGPHTAAMLASYENEPDNKGMLLIDREEMFERGRKAVANGLSLAIHAIGDRANHEILNAFEQLRAFEATLPTAGQQPLRHRIEHVQLIHPEDAPRLAQGNIIASMQPIHATSDMLMADAYWGERAANSYAWRTQLQHGAKLVFGSDAPVESPNPFWGLHAAVTRQRIDGNPGPDGWYPEQRLNIHEALLAFTQGPAYAAGMEDHLGKLAPGYFADLLVLEDDPFTCEPSTLRNIVPSAVMVGGEWVLNR